MDGMAKWMEGRSVDRWLAARKLIKYRKYTRVSSKRKKTGTVVVVVVGEEIRRRYQRDGIVQVGGSGAASVRQAWAPVSI